MSLEAVIDYETRSEANLKKTGAIVYARHPTTAIFCLSYQIDDSEPMLWIPERCPMPKDLWEVFKCGTLKAHNASFERAITRWTLPQYPLLTSEQRKCFQLIDPSRWRCLAAKAAMSSLPRGLKGAALALELDEQKDETGSRLILKYSKPRKPSKKNPKLWWDDKRELRGIYRYCLNDTITERAVDEAVPDLSPKEQKIWELDQKINDRGVLFDIPAVKKILKLVDAEMTEIIRRTKLLSKGEVESPAKREKLLNWVNARGANIANLRAPTIRDRLLAEDLNPRVREMLEYRQMGSKTSTAKYEAMIQGVGDDDRGRELLLYSGATPTARWSGKRIQPQNFPRPTVKEPGKPYFDSNHAIELALTGGRKALADHYGTTKVMNVLVSIVRGMIIASPGCELLCADFAAIEARLAFWICEHHEGIRAFVEGRKLYEEMAVEAFAIPMEQVTKESLERFVGKETVLGAQYGLGPDKHHRNCHQKGMSQVTNTMARQAIYAYRRVHWPVPAFWKAIEEACLRAILNPTRRYKVTKVSVYMSGPWLCIKLPSGRRLRYFKPRVAQKQLPGGRMVPELRHMAAEKGRWVEISIWGGTLLNNIVQGVARDLMANGMKNIENAGYKFLLSIHDEGLSEREIGEGSVEEYVALMTKLPKWAKGAPVTAEGWKGTRYRK